MTFKGTNSPHWRTLPSGVVEFEGSGVEMLPTGSLAPIERWRGLIAAASVKHGVPERWIAGVIYTESRGNPNALSPAGAVGLMQLMPQFFGGNAGNRLLDPATNIDAGSAFLAKLRRAGNDLVESYSCYNAGPDRNLHPKPSPSKPFGLAHDPPAILLTVRASNSWEGSTTTTRRSGAPIALALAGLAWLLRASIARLPWRLCYHPRLLSYLSRSARFA